MPKSSVFILNSFRLSSRWCGCTRDDRDYRVFDTCGGLAETSSPQMLPEIPEIDMLT